MLICEWDNINAGLTGLSKGWTEIMWTTGLAQGLAPKKYS